MTRNRLTVTAQEGSLGASVPDDVLREAGYEVGDGIGVELHDGVLVLTRVPCQRQPSGSTRTKTPGGAAFIAAPASIAMTAPVGTGATPARCGKAPSRASRRQPRTLPRGASASAPVACAIPSALSPSLAERFPGARTSPRWPSRRSPASRVLPPPRRRGYACIAGVTYQQDPV